MHSQPKAVVLLSGGMDSTTTLALAKHQGFAAYALTFRYGQRHQVEIEAARQLCYYAAAEKDTGRRCDYEAGLAKAGVGPQDGFSGYKVFGNPPRPRWGDASAEV